MSLRWRRSLPTEKARSPAPVTMATRTLGRTAIVSKTSVSRAPISVVIALSACGRLRVMTATRPSEPYSTSTGESGSARSDGGGPKSSAFQRSVRVGLVATWSSFPGDFDARSGLQLRQPAQRSQPRREAILAAAGDDERRQALQAAPDWPLRDGERAGPVVRPGERVLLGRRADEDAVVDPLGLDELELALEMRTDEHEDDSSVDAVVLQDAFGQHGTVAGAAPDHAMQADVDASLVVERVSRVGAPRVRASRAPEAAQIVVVVEVVVARRIRTELGIVVVRGERQGRATLPASDHLGAQQRLLLPAGGSFAEVASVGRDAGVQLPEHDVGAVAAEQLRGRHRRQTARLVGIAEDELAGLDRSLPGVGAWDPAALHRLLADPVLEAEGGAPRGKLVAVLAPDHLHPGQLLVGAAGPLD